MLVLASCRPFDVEEASCIISVEVFSDSFQKDCTPTTNLK